MYDFDGDGKIGREELTAMLRATLDEHSLVLDEKQLDSVIQVSTLNISIMNCCISNKYH